MSGFEEKVWTVLINLTLIFIGFGILALLTNSFIALAKFAALHLV